MEIKEMIKELDEIQEVIEKFEENEGIKAYLQAIEERDAIIGEIKEYIKSGTIIKETGKFVFKTTYSYSYSPELLRKKLGEEASKYIKVKETVDSDLLKKDIKANIISQDLEDCKELLSMKVVPIPKRNLLTEVEI